MMLRPNEKSLVSNAKRPFVGDRYTVAVVTSTQRNGAVPLTPDTLVERELKTYPSYVSPWSLHVFPDEVITKRVEQVDRKTMTAVAEGIRELTAVE